MFRCPAFNTRAWLDDLFAAKAVGMGGIVRRAVRDVGRAALVSGVRRGRFHLIECGGRFIIICNPGQMQVICQTHPGLRTLWKILRPAA